MQPPQPHPALISLSYLKVQPRSLNYHRSRLLKQSNMFRDKNLTVLGGKYRPVDYYISGFSVTVLAVKWWALQSTKWQRHTAFTQVSKLRLNTDGWNLNIKGESLNPAAIWLATYNDTCSIRELLCSMHLFNNTKFCQDYSDHGFTCMPQISLDNP